MGRAEAARRFLKWILGETSPTIYVAFWKKKRENLATWKIPSALIFCIDMVNPIYALILAGGSGERFWPLSRRARPKQLLHLVSKKNIVAEPAKRDTAAAVALGAGWVAARDHAATMLVLPADHVIANHVAFQEILTLAAETAEETGELVTIGIKPTWACPGYG